MKPGASSTANDTVRSFTGPCALPLQSIDTLFPMHLVVDGSGLILSTGRTLTRVLDTDITGQLFFDIFKVLKPRNCTDTAALTRTAGRRFSVQSKLDAPLDLRCTAVPFEDGDISLLIDMAFASDLIAALNTYGLTSADFRANDPSLDLVVTLETQAALLQDARRMAQALETAKQAAERRAVQDPVTGMPNRRGLEEHLAGLQSEGTGTWALLHIDLDKFKPINDIYGHAAGDFVLTVVADILTERAAHHDGGLAARIGGDEFALLLPVTDTVDHLLTSADMIIARISAPVRYDGQSLSLGASIGIAIFEASETLTASAILSDSDIALYRAKEAGNSATLVTPEMLSTHRAQLALVEEIEAGLEREEFRPHFQPQIDTSTGDVVGLEVVARWYHPDRGILTPAMFFECATRTNLIQGIDRMVRRAAITEFATWVEDGLQARRLSLNMTAANLRSAAFLEELMDELMEAALSPTLIRLEILESILFDADDRAIAERSARLKSAGFTLALDDFGTGHASLATLLAAPISLLKIDRSFVSGIDQDQTLQRITGSIIAMADQLGLAVMAEGVETAAEVALLRRFGCHLFQGYYFGRPLSATATRGWLQDWTSEAPDTRLGFS